MEQLSIFDVFNDETTQKNRPKESNEWRWSLKDYPKKNGVKVFSFFSCGGGSTMGYKLAGCEVLGNCEIDEKMNKIYLKNHKPKYNYNMDIRKFNEIPDNEIPEDLFDLDILDGSPPCTTFSMAGEREESWGKKKKFREGQAEQTLDDLSFVFIESVNKLKPKTVIMENVEGLILGEAFNYVRKIYDDFDRIGYRVFHWLLKGEYMGVPQTRHRVFFVAIRKDLNKFPHNIDMTFNYKPITYGVIKSGKGRKLSETTQAYKVIKQAKNTDKRVADVYKRIGEKERCFNHKIAWEDKVLQTLTANLEYTRGAELCSISCEDVIAAQTFPYDYDFIDNDFNNVSYICGMSVPPVMTKRVAEKVIEFMGWK